MLELFTPYLFQDSYRRRTDQEHPSAKERSSVLKTLKTIGTTYIPSLSAIKTLFDQIKPGNSGKRDFIQLLYSGSKMADTVKNIYQLLKYISAAQMARHKSKYSDSD
jgi:hypothetical protein